MLIDTHCHLNLIEHYPDPRAEVEYALSCGVGQLIVVGVDVSSSQTAIDLAETFAEVFAVAGIHPNYTATYQPDQLSILREMLRHPRVVALGEIGLDYHWDYASRDQQYDALKAQLDLAEDCRMPVVFHCREAYGDLLDILEARSRGQSWLLHCFAGDQTDARRAIDLGCYFGVDGPLTYKNAQSLRDLVLTLPRDRIVIETDAPYLTPVPHRGKPNRPGYVAYVNSMLASLWGLPPEEAAGITTANAERFFGL